MSKKIKVIPSKKEFEEFVNRQDINIIDVDITGVSQSAFAQEHFIAVIYYEEKEIK